MNTNTATLSGNIVVVTVGYGVKVNQSKCGNCGLTVNQDRSGEFPAFHIGTRATKCE